MRLLIIVTLSAALYLGTMTHFLNILALLQINLPQMFLDALAHEENLYHYLLQHAYGANQCKAKHSIQTEDLILLKT